MSISLKQFKEGKFTRKGVIIPKEIELHPAVAFLKKNKRAFTIKEICESTNKKEETIRFILRDRIKKGILVHKAPYFTYKR